MLDMLPSIGKAAPRRREPAMYEFGTPACVIDEADFRQRARHYRRALREVEIVYAAKSPLTTAVARRVREDGLGIDVCSPGELAVALAAGVDPIRVIVHGNAESPDELLDAVAAGVGRIVVDSEMEIAYLAALARRRQRVLVGVYTGCTDHGPTADAVRRVLAHPILDLIGLYCDIGSQVTDAGRYGAAIRRMVAVMADIRAHNGVILTELNIGGGPGVPSVGGDRGLDLRALAAVIEDALDEACATWHFPRPAVALGC